MKNIDGRRAAVLFGGAAIYALLFSLCSQIDETGTCAASPLAPRFFLAFFTAAFALWLLLEKLPRLPKLCGGGRRFRCCPRLR